jgi:hypothetical protein
LRGWISTPSLAINPKKKRKNGRLHMEFMHFQMKFNLYFYVVCLPVFFSQTIFLVILVDGEYWIVIYSGFFFQMAKSKYNIKGGGIIVEFYNIIIFLKMLEIFIALILFHFCILNCFVLMC